MLDREDFEAAQRVYDHVDYYEVMGLRVRYQTEEYPGFWVGGTVDEQLRRSDGKGGRLVLEFWPDPFDSSQFTAGRYGRRLDVQGLEVGLLDFADAYAYRFVGDAPPHKKRVGEKEELAAFEVVDDG